MKIGQDWDSWKKLLGKAVQAAEFAGISDEHICDIAHVVGNVLADKFDPANREQRLIKELWDASDDDERRILASLMARIAEKGAN